MKTAIVTGITGQDGSYLAEQLLNMDYHVVGVIRRSASQNHWRINHYIDHPNLKIVDGDVSDANFIIPLIVKLKPHEFYNLAAMSFVKYSFDNPVSTLVDNTLSVATIISALEQYSPKTRLYQASTSEMFGGMPETAPQNEDTPFTPQSPYGVAKLASHHLIRLARDRGLFACAGILFNHEGPRRGIEFVTQKIVTHALEITQGKREYIELGYIDAKRDWGYAPEFTEGMRLMLQQDCPDDYILATGETYSVREFLTWTLDYLGLSFEEHFRVNKKFMRSNEVKILCGDASKAKEKLRWEARVKGRELVEKMIIGASDRLL